VNGLKDNRFSAAFCLLFIVAPYWALMFSPGEAGIAQRFFAVGIAIIADGMVLAGIRLAVRVTWSEGGRRIFLLMFPAMTFFFLVALRNSFGALILYATSFPDMFMATQSGTGVLVFMTGGLVFTAFEFLIVRRIVKTDV